MPNWVYNNLTMKAKSEKEKNEIKEYLKNEEQVISFEKILPRPAEELDWYSWNISNWGCKWDASQSQITGESDKEVGYCFDTPWSLPAGVLDKLSKKYDFDLLFEEEQGWGGKAEARNGLLKVIEEWDIPDSHEALKKRGRDCYCDSSGEPAFSDCHYEKAILDPSISASQREFIKVLGINWEGDYDSLVTASKNI